MKKLFTCEEISALFPELEMLKNEEWKKKIVSIWKEVYESSAWDNLCDAWYSPLTPGIDLVRHTRANVLCALGLVDVLKKLFNEDVNREVLIAACFLHDVCKLVEYIPCEIGACKGPVGQAFQHGFFSGYYAQREGFPPEVVSIIVSHTSESKKIPKTLEGLALYYADVADCDFHRFIAGSPLLIDTHK